VGLSMLGSRFGTQSEPLHCGGRMTKTIVGYFSTINYLPSETVGHLRERPLFCKKKLSNSVSNCSA
jgi:hypothetical protein